MKETGACALVLGQDVVGNDAAAQQEQHGGADDLGQEDGAEARFRNATHSLSGAGRHPVMRRGDVLNGAARHVAQNEETPTDPPR